ncbi:hypothetical protein GQ457_10G009450 [Hibiscus cannabinus]
MLVCVEAEQDIFASVTSDTPYVETNEEVVECAFRALEFVNAAFITEATVGKGTRAGKGLGKKLQGILHRKVAIGKKDQFGLSFKPNFMQRKREWKKKQERRRARLKGEDVLWEPIFFPRLRDTFTFGGIVNTEQKVNEAIQENDKLKDEEMFSETLEGMIVNMVSEGGEGSFFLSEIHPCLLGETLNNCTCSNVPDLLYRDPYVDLLAFNKKNASCQSHMSNYTPIYTRPIWVLKFENPNVATNPLPNHGGRSVKTIDGDCVRKTKGSILEVTTPMRWIFRRLCMARLIDRGMVIVHEGSRPYCEYHHAEGHDILLCKEFRHLVQSMMDNKEIEFFERPLVISLKPMAKISPQEGPQGIPKLVISTPTLFLFKITKKVPWNYTAHEAQPAQEEGSFEKEVVNEIGHFTRSGRCYSPETAKILEAAKNKGEHDRIVDNIVTNNYITFSDDKIPEGGMGFTKALTITSNCKGYVLVGVLIDNGSALNVLPLATLQRLPIDSSHIKPFRNYVRAFDGTQRETVGKIEIPLLIGPTKYTVEFVLMDIKPTYNCLLGRSFIHSAGALVCVEAEQDIIASITSDTPYVEPNEEVVECAFRALEFLNAAIIAEGARARKGLGKKLQGSLRPKVAIGKKDQFELKETIKEESQGEGRGLNEAIQENDKLKDEEMFSEIPEGMTINMVSEGGEGSLFLSGINPCLPGETLNN